jgi:hypothetical protein
MDAAWQQHLPLVAVALSAAALLFSLVAAFPGLKGVLSAVRDGVLWVALLLVAGGIGFVVWQQLQRQDGAATTAAANPASPASASRPAPLSWPAFANQRPVDSASVDPRAAIQP